MSHVAPELKDTISPVLSALSFPLTPPPPTSASPAAFLTCLRETEGASGTHKQKHNKLRMALAAAIVCVY